MIAPGAAVGLLLNRVRVTGPLAFMMWGGIHVLYLIGFRSRFSVMMEWVYYLLTRRRSVRLITGEKLWPTK